MQTHSSEMHRLQLINWAARSVNLHCLCCHVHQGGLQLWLQSTSEEASRYKAAYPLLLFLYSLFLGCPVSSFFPKKVICWQAFKQGSEFCAGWGFSHRLLEAQFTGLIQLMSYTQHQKGSTGKRNQTKTNSKIPNKPPTLKKGKARTDHTSYL